jgi:hypothetical protein
VFTYAATANRCTARVSLHGSGSRVPEPFARLVSGARHQSVLDQTDNDLNNGAGHATADELACQGGDIESRRGVTGCRTRRPAKQSAEQLAPADTSDRAGNQVTDASQIRARNNFATGRSAENTTNQLCDNSFHGFLRYGRSIR